MLWRTVIGFIVCPLFPGMLMDLLAMGRLYGIATLVSAFIAYPVTCVIYLPTYFALAALKWRGIVVYSAVGTILAVLIYMVPTLLSYLDDGLLPLRREVFQVPFFLGLIPTVAFWLLARPDLGTLKLSMSAQKPAVQYVFLTKDAES